MDKSDLGRKIGALSPGRVDEILSGVALLLRPVESHNGAMRTSSKVQALS
jgi:hypothetical protein